jgi:hypothetical protein
VLGLRQFEPDAFAELPPLLTAGGADPLVTALAARDRDLYLVLDSSRVLRDDGDGTAA